MAYSNPSYTGSPWPYSLCTVPCMDAEAERSVSPPCAPGSWKVNRFLTDNKASFSSYPAMDSVTSEIVAPLPSSHFQGPESPSWTNSSSTCDTGLSPPRETDYYPVHSPPTPPNVSLFPQYDSWNYKFTGLADGCVNLGDVNPMQDLSANYYEDTMQRFEYPLRTCSMSSDESNASYKSWVEEEAPQLARCLGPNTPDVKEEICIPDHTVQIRQASIVEDLELTDDHKSPYVKAELDENDDDEYKPHKTTKTGYTKSTRTAGKSHKRRSTTQSSSHSKRVKAAMEESLVVRSSSKPAAQGAKGQFPCPQCLKVAFADANGLDNHIKKQHTRPFTCIFEFAGCHSTFASKNEWKRHCASQHIVLQYWVCQKDGCAQVSNKFNAPKKSSSGSRRRSGLPRHSATSCSPALPNGTIFNRKDLYTQHLRRMHVPAHLKNKVKSKSHAPEWEELERVCQEEAIRTRCQLPVHMVCPAQHCSVRFDGTNAWDDRMEHVAKHLEKIAAGTEPSIQFGGDDDSTLVDWATSPAIGILRSESKGGWTLQNPLRATGYPVPPVPPVPSADHDQDDDDEDADAEGEEVEDE
ncbi:hypothetical protein F5Y14DRAFT_141866 [Nemania sp. NC0429]|nr:hypothetical protein F5Y14DRAFT_141866 [Nemania sp. NC0429]